MAGEGRGPGIKWWRPDRLAARRANLAARGRILGAVRDFFAEEGFIEVETPALQVSPGLEPHLETHPRADQRLHRSSHPPGTQSANLAAEATSRRNLRRNSRSTVGARSAVPA